VTEWDKVKVMDQALDKMGRLIREAIWIRKTNINQNEGRYQWSHVWDKLLLTDKCNWKSDRKNTSDSRSKRH